MNGDPVRQEQLVAVGPTYRQIDHWTRTGLLRLVDGIRTGSGFARLWPAEEVEIAGMMHRLCQAGIGPDLAHQIARAGGDHEIGPGIRVTVGPVQQ